MNDLIERLRYKAEMIGDGSHGQKLLYEAADELERLMPTKEDKLAALNCISSPYEYTNRARDLLRRYVLQEKQP